MKIIHLTDTHLVRPGETLFGLDPLQRLRAAVDHINTHQDDAEAVMVTGDLTNWADPEAFASFVSETDRLVMPVYPVIGNHDSRDGLHAALPDLPRDPNGYFQYRLDMPAGRFLVLDTIQPGTHAGAYDDHRLAWLDRELREAGDANVYVFAHHPSFPIRIPMMDTISVDRSPELVDTLTRYGNVRHYFFGHVHRPVSGSFRGIPFSTLYGTNHQVDLDFVNPKFDADTVHEPPAYNVVFLEPDLTLVHTCFYLDNSRRVPWDDETGQRP